MKIKNKLIAFSATAIACATLIACGGSGSSGLAPSTTKQVALQTYITDNLTLDYSRVWVSIKKITAKGADGVEVVLLDATAAPRVVNLSSLAAVGELMSSVSVPAGIYTEVEVTLQNSINLISNDGLTTTAAKFKADDTDFVLSIKNASVDATNGGQLVLDFNLSNFTYNAVTGLVTPEVLLPRPEDAFRKFVRQQAEVKGTVLVVNAAASTVTISNAQFPAGLIVTLAADGVVLNEGDGAVLTLAGIEVGKRIEVKGKVKPGETVDTPATIEAAVIHIEGAGDDVPSEFGPRLRGEGSVVSVSGNIIYLSLSEASFLPGSELISIDATNAAFPHGSLESLAPGVKLKFRGSRFPSNEGAQIMAKVIDVEGAPSRALRETMPGSSFREIRGTLGEMTSEGVYTVRVEREADHPFKLDQGTYTVDFSRAVFDAGNVRCLIPGAEVGAQGLAVGKRTRIDVPLNPGPGAPGFGVPGFEIAAPVNGPVTADTSAISVDFMAARVEIKDCAGQDRSGGSRPRTEDRSKAS